MIILGGYIKPIIKPVEKNYAEYRTANQIPKFTEEGFKNKTFQNSYEEAYADQIPLSNRMKIAKKSMDLVMKIQYANINSKGVYKYLGSTYLVDDYLVYYFESIQSNKDGFDRKIKNINAIVDKLDNVDFYLYLIEKDMDINFETNEKSGADEYIKSRIDSRIKFAKFSIDSLKDYKNYFYKTDHHWNYKGSYKGYLEVAKLLEVDSKPLTYKNEVCLPSIVNGSKGRNLGGTLYFNEQFCTYEYDFPKYKYWINNVEYPRISDADILINTKPEQITYASWYGYDYALTRYYNIDSTNDDNILIIGDSFDNAINELIAAHFSNTYNVDLRQYENSFKKKFNINEFVSSNKITKILFIGNVGFYSSDEFLIEGVE